MNLTHNAANGIGNGLTRITDGIIHVQEEALGIPDAPCNIEILELIEAVEIFPEGLSTGRVGVELIAFGW